MSRERSERTSAPVAVAGWSTSTSARLEDLDLLAARLALTAARLAESGLTAQAVAVDADLVSSLALAPDTGAEAQLAITRASLGPGGAVAVGARFEATALLVSAVVQAYRDAEATATALVDGAGYTGDFLLGQTLTLAAPALGVGAGTLYTGARQLLGPTVTDALVSAASTQLLSALQSCATAHPDLVQTVAGGSSGLLSGSAGAVLAPLAPFGAVAFLAGLPASTSDVARLVGRSYVDGVPVVRPADVPYATYAASSLGGLFGGLAASTEGSDGGRITIRTLTSTDSAGASTTSYVVELPGMEEMTAPGNTDDIARENGSNLRLVGAEPCVYTLGIRQALRMARVPAGATVALVGHSQGGLAAYQLANDPTFTGTYHVTHVATAGSPVSSLPRNPGVRYLALENAHDLVPTLDGAAMKAAPGLVTARFSVDRHTIVGNHAMTLYAEQAVELDDSTDPDLAAYRRSLVQAGILGRPGAPTTVTAQAWRVSSDRTHH